MSKPNQTKAGVYRITRLTLCRLRRLLPGERTNRIVTYQIAVQSMTHEVETKSYAIVDQGLVLEVHAKRDNLSDFLRDLMKGITQGLQEAQDFDGSLWDSGQRPWRQQVNGDDDEYESLIQVLSSPVAAGLVRQAEDWVKWGGGMSLPWQLGTERLIRRPAEYGECWPEWATLRLGGPVGMKQGETQGEWVQRVCGDLRKRSHLLGAEMAAEGLRVMTRSERKAARVDDVAGPCLLEKRRKLFTTEDPEKLGELMKLRREFLRQYERARKELGRFVKRVEFPPGTDQLRRVAACIVLEVGPIYVWAPCCGVGSAA